jgi:hypothetical protein
MPDFYADIVYAFPSFYYAISVCYSQSLCSRIMAAHPTLIVAQNVCLATSPSSRMFSPRCPFLTIRRQLLIVCSLNILFVTRIYLAVHSTSPVCLVLHIIRPRTTCPPYHVTRTDQNPLSSQKIPNLSLLGSPGLIPSVTARRASPAGRLHTRCHL